MEIIFKKKLPRVGLLILDLKQFLLHVVKKKSVVILYQLQYVQQLKTRRILS
jgi:hypothetical protein